MTNERLRTAPTVLTIAGFDPSGGAGIIADIRTIEAFDCTAVAGITSITFQNANAYSGALHQTAASLRAQVEGILAEHQIAAVKIGMLPTAEIVHEAAQLIRQFDLPLPVIDPVMESTSGGKLMADDAFEVLVTNLLPLTRVVTPNIPEAEKLSGMNIGDDVSMRQAAARIRELGARAVLIKGGHRYRAASGSERVNTATQDTEPSRVANDLLDDDGQVAIVRGDWIDAPQVRGTGCILSSAIACGLAKGDELKQAVSTAKQFITKTINDSKFKIED